MLQNLSKLAVLSITKVNSLKNAFFWSFLTNYLGIGVNFLSVVLLARMLTPSEIGTYAIAGAIFAIAQIFRDMGISGYLLREKELTPIKLSGAMTIVWLLCTSISLLLLLASLPLAAFYSIPELTTIFQILCLNIFLIPCGTIAQTHLRRAMRFKALGAIELTSQIIHLIVALILAYNSLGAVSLAIASLSATICTLLLVNIAYKGKKQFALNFANANIVLPSISTIGLANILTTLNNRVTPLIIGKSISENAVAIMDKALATIELLNQLLMQAIQKVLLPYFTKLREEKGNISEAYLLVTNYTLLFALPFLFYISVLSEFVELTLFGDQWVDAIPLVPIFALSSAFGMTVRYFGEITISLGLEKILMRVNLTVFVIKVVAVLIVSSYGLFAVGYSILAISILRTFYILSLIKSYMNIGYFLFLQNTAKTFLVSFISAIPYLIGNIYNVPFTKAVEVIILFVTVVIAWLTSIFIVNHKARHDISILLKPIVNRSLLRKE